MQLVRGEKGRDVGNEEGGGGKKGGREEGNGGRRKEGRGGRRGRREEGGGRKEEGEGGEEGKRGRTEGEGDVAHYLLQWCHSAADDCLTSASSFQECQLYILLQSISLWRERRRRKGGNRGVEGGGERRVSTHTWYCHIDSMYIADKGGTVTHKQSYS